MKEKKLREGVNTGVFIEPKADDWFIKGYSGLTYKETLKSGNWRAWLPTDERQSNTGGDAMSCVSGATCHAIDTQLHYFMETGQLELGLIDWLRSEGYIDLDGRPNTSQRALAKISGTTKNGNSPNRVANAADNEGFLPESDWTWDWNRAFNWNEFYSTLPQNLMVKMNAFLKFFDIGYEWVANGEPATRAEIEYHLKHAPLILAAPTCPPWGEGIIPACGAPACHMTEIFNREDYTEIEDTYAPYQKKLAADYPLNYVMKVVVSPLTFEITTEQARYALNKFEEIRNAFPASNGLVSPEDPNYTIYDWCKRYGVYQHYDIFVDGIIDYTGIEELIKPEMMPPMSPLTIQKKNNWLNLIWQFIKKLLTF